MSWREEYAGAKTEIINALPNIKKASEDLRKAKEHYKNLNKDDEVKEYDWVLEELNIIDTYISYLWVAEWELEKLANKIGGSLGG